MINVNDIKSLSRHSIYVMHFKLVGLTNADRYVSRKRDSERSETGAKPQVMGSGAKPLEVECIAINQFIFEMNIQCISRFPLTRCIHYRQAKKRHEHWHELDIRKL